MRAVQLVPTAHPQEMHVAHTQDRAGQSPKANQDSSTQNTHTLTDQAQSTRRQHACHTQLMPPDALSNCYPVGPSTEAWCCVHVWFNCGWTYDWPGFPVEMGGCTHPHTHTHSLANPSAKHHRPFNALPTKQYQQTRHHTGWGLPVAQAHAMTQVSAGFLQPGHLAWPAWGHAPMTVAGPAAALQTGLSEMVLLQLQQQLHEHNTTNPSRSTTNPRGNKLLS